MQMNNASSCEEPRREPRDPNAIGLDGKVAASRCLRSPKAASPRKPNEPSIGCMVRHRH